MNIFILNLINIRFMNFQLFSLGGYAQFWKSNVLFDVRFQNLFSFLENFLLLQSLWQSFLENKHVNNRYNHDYHNRACSSFSRPFFILNVRLYFWRLHLLAFWLSSLPQFWSEHSVRLFSWYQRFLSIKWIRLLNFLMNLNLDLWDIRIHIVFNVVNFFHKLLDFLVEFSFHEFWILNS